MPKRLISQRRGKGSRTFIAPPKKAKADIKYIGIDDKQRNDVLKGQVMELITDSGRSSVMAKLVFEDNSEDIIIAAEGLTVGDQIQYGKKAELAIGNVLPIGEIVEGCPIFNIEALPGDGGTYVRSSGLYGLIVTKDKNNVYVKLPSGKTVALGSSCRATVGCAAGGGRLEKPFVKAGRKYFAMKARGKVYPIVRGVAMNPVSHPFGGSQHHAGKSKSVSRHSPPGTKVGNIASKRTGRKKKK